MLDNGYRMLQDTRYKMLDNGYRLIQDTGYKMLDIGYRMLQDTEYKMLDNGYRMLGNGYVATCPTLSVVHTRCRPPWNHSPS